ncbi:solute carrier family 28 member 3-like isoform X2 [Phymastichus coffea]|uniref:solute carrier family 28 member 3-like isoform X2 n=1 Tax=Phymastichus coffea TaxID=108790 RepID=UPI00273AB931|nr:solute carrier family 28 member 3-like isoform X2 [Phymastichus coffea]
MTEGITNQAFNEVGRKLSRHSLNISIKLEDDESVESEDRPSKEPNNESDKRSVNYLRAFIDENGTFFRYVRIAILNLIIITYFVFASIYWINHKTEDFGWCDGYGMLILIVGFSYFGILYQKVFKKCLSKLIITCFLPCESHFASCKQRGCFVRSIKTVFCLTVLVGIAIFLILDTVQSRNRLISFTGVAAILAFGWVFSKHPTRINWRPVIWGLILQFSFGLFTIRWAVGRSIFQCLSNKVATFLNFAQAGAKFVFSNELVDNGVFAFSALPVIFFFSFMIQVLYYWGVMQSVIRNIGWILHSIMGTTVCESINSAANTFLGMTESPLLIKPYLNKLTNSEIHAIMCSGFATVSGTVLAAYIKFGANPTHLITATVMSAPAALCFSKLFYPETEKSVTTFENIVLEKSQDTSVIDAATKGALAGIPLILGIIANIIAFVSAVAFINAILSWLGELIGYDFITFEWLLSKAFMPLSWLIGVPWTECEDVGQLIGLKTVVNEFVAYQKLGQFKEEQRLSARSEAIATYAICGFSNPGSIGIMIGGLSTMAPEKREQITNIAMRSFIAGSMVTFLTASIAGILMDDSYFETVS